MNRMRTFIRKWKGFFRGYLVQKAEEGMTLIELMVVIVILGIIAAVAIPSISGVISTSKTNTTLSNLSTIQQALSRYEINNSSFPAKLSDLTSSSNGGPYLDVTFPENDSWGNPIYYAPVGTGDTGYYLISGGATGTVTATTGPKGLIEGDIYAAGGNLGTGFATATPTLVGTPPPTIDTGLTFTDN